MKGYIILSNSLNCELGRYEVDTNKPISEELIRTINDQKLFLQEGDIIWFSSI